MYRTTLISFIGDSFNPGSWIRWTSGLCLVVDRNVEPAIFADLLGVVPKHKPVSLNAWCKLLSRISSLPINDKRYALKVSVSSDPTPSCSEPTRAVACNVMSVEELQHVVSLLPPEELDRFSKWFEEFLADQWDRCIEADILAGRLDEVGRRADEDFESGRCTPLH
jgi:hypothetical protein